MGYIAGIFTTKLFIFFIFGELRLPLDFSWFVLKRIITPLSPPQFPGILTFLAWMLAVREVSDGLGIETRVNEELASHVTGRAQFLSFYSLSLFS